MTANTITERGMEDFSTELWSLSNAAVDLSTDITTGDITTANAAKKFNSIVNGLRELLQTCDEP